MPERRPSDVIHVQSTDHLIRAKPVRADPAVEVHDGNTPPYRGPVALYYPMRAPRTSAADLDIAVAQVKQQSNLTAGAAELARLIERYRPVRSEYYFELGEARRNLGQSDAAIAALTEAARRQPARWRHSYALALALADARRFVEALETLARIEPSAIVSAAKGEVWSRQGNLARAIDAYREGLAGAPDFADLWNNLGAALLRRGDVREGESALREALQLRPDIAAAHVNLGNLLAGQKRGREAEYHLEHAVRLAPDAAIAHLNLAVLLLQRGERDRAAAHLREAQKSSDEDLRRAAGALLER
jgi:tetratricopeptide (TPR) repeat protein